jgi:hypothetical protein
MVPVLREIAGAYQLLWCVLQYSSGRKVHTSSKENNIQVVKQTKPKEKFQLAGLSEISRKTSPTGSQDPP